MWPFSLSSYEFTGDDIGIDNLIIGKLTVTNGINLSGGTVGAANVIDFGSGDNNDLTATDVTDLTDGGQTSLHSHGPLTAINITLTDIYANDGTMILDGANVAINLTDAVSDYNMVIDNTTSGTVTSALVIGASGADGSAITNAIDASDAEIVSAIKIGANKINGDNFKFDGVGQFQLGTGGGGGGNRGTGILTFIGGGAIDSTLHGDIVIQPDDAGIVDFPSGTTVRLPPASPIENRNGLFWDLLSNRLCIDRSTDLCTVTFGSSYARTLVVLGSDQDNSNATANTLEDVTGLSFEVVNGTTYRFFSLIAFTTAAAASGTRWTINGPASPTYLSYRSTYTSTATVETVNNASTYQAPAASSASSLTAGDIAIIEGIVIPSTNGTIQVQHASEVASSLTTAKAGSTLEFW